MEAERSRRRSKLVSMMNLLHDSLSGLCCSTLAVRPRPSWTVTVSCNNLQSKMLVTNSRNLPLRKRICCSAAVAAVNIMTKLTFVWLLSSANVVSGSNSKAMDFAKSVHSLNSSKYSNGLPRVSRFSGQGAPLAAHLLHTALARCFHAGGSASPSAPRPLQMASLSPTTMQNCLRHNGSFGKHDAKVSFHRQYLAGQISSPPARRRSRTAGRPAPADPRTVPGWSASPGTGRAARGPGSAGTAASPCAAGSSPDTSSSPSFPEPPRSAPC
mmetsp:Transcript_96296/g.294530  ORF Transcript_96296/g.294530 Transcript_96296/m.294530 type:complete len:270 (-) Transcript_96296:660-1469(-)